MGHYSAWSWKSISSRRLGAEVATLGNDVLGILPSFKGNNYNEVFISLITKGNENAGGTHVQVASCPTGWWTSPTIDPETFLGMR